jgi:hypothetical protein
LEHFQRAMQSFRPQCSIAAPPGRSSIDVTLAGQAAPQGLPPAPPPRPPVAGPLRPAPTPTVIQPGASAHASNVIYVDELNGSNVSGTGTRERPYKTLGEALQHGRTPCTYLCPRTNRLICNVQ